MNPKDGQLTKHKIIISSVCETFNYTTLFFVCRFSAFSNFDFVRPVQMFFTTNFLFAGYRIKVFMWILQVQAS